MNKGEFKIEMDRIWRNYSKQEDTLFEDDVWQKYSNRHPALFRRIVTHILERTTFFPRLAAFYQAEQAVVDTWREQNRQEAKCPTCGGTGFQPVYYTILRAGGEIPCSGVRPCRTCNRYKPKHATTAHRDITREEYLKLMGLLFSPEPAIASEENEEGISLRRRLDITADTYKQYPHSEILAWMMQDLQRRIEEEEATLEDSIARALIEREQNKNE